ncbi:MAG: hypothetical protein KDD22_05370 [Bdellovibrionales bacterium]|nr:hypothetical protein [Bdellovibrionales bacterium]
MLDPLIDALLTLKAFSVSPTLLMAGLFVFSVTLIFVLREFFTWFFKISIQNKRMDLLERRMAAIESSLQTFIEKNTSIKTPKPAPTVTATSPLLINTVGDEKTTLGKDMKIRTIKRGFPVSH